MSTQIDELIGLSGEVAELCKEANLEELKINLTPLAGILENMLQDKAAAEAELAEINKQIIETEKKIRAIWEPMIRGAEKATIDLGRIKLSSEQKLNVSVGHEENARASAIDWLCSNGYKDVMKYDINTNTMKSIATGLLKESDVKIPGLNYSTFNKIKLT